MIRSPKFAGRGMAAVTDFSFHPTLRTSLLRISQRGLSTYTDAQNLAYFNSAVGDEVTSKENETAWKRVRLVPRVLVGVEKVDLTATFPLLGNQTLPIPILNAPTAFHELVS
jgi:isopentenyl diphosphate isomerase/L-lactate dehydrogenase-like FMN-dependent dehydrogenase